MIHFNCEKCGKKYALNDDKAGKQGRCSCGNALIVPDIASDVLRGVEITALKPIPDDELQPTEAKQPSTPPKQEPYIAPKSRGFSFLSDKLKPYFNFDKMVSVHAVLAKA